MTVKEIKRRRGKCPVFFAFNHKGECVAVRCGLWTCPECARRNAQLWAWRVSLHITKRGKPAYFWTITMRGKYKTAEDAYKALPRLWDNLRKIIQRAFGSWEYIAFVEAHPHRSNIPHFHIISMRKSPRRIKDIAHEAGFGYQAKEKLVQNSQAAVYVAKYASKTDEKMPKNFRRVRACRTWTKLPDFAGHELFVKSKTETLSEYLIRVNEATGINIDELLERWYTLTDKYAENQ